jgi:TolB-like protein
MTGKRIIVGVLLTLLSATAFSQSMTLDEAIKTTALELAQRINANRIPNLGSSNQSIQQTAEEIRRQLTVQYKIAVLSFSSDWRGLSTYVIDELNTAIVREGSLTVVNKQQLDLVREELDFQMSGEVSDESQQSKGQFLGAQAVLTGSFTAIGNTYRFRVRAITVETGVELYSNSIDIKKDNVLTTLTPKPPKTRSSWSTIGTIFEDYTLYNGLTLFGYIYSPDKPVGFSLGIYGVYTSFGFAVPSWGDYIKTNDSNSNTGYPWGTPDYNSTPYTDQRYQIVDWVLGYNVTIIPNILYLPLGVGMESIKEWRLQNITGGAYNAHYYFEWNPAPQWEKLFLFEAGLLFRVMTPINFAPYLFGTYRNVGTNKHTFSIGAGGCFDFLANDR